MLNKPGVLVQTYNLRRIDKFRGCHQLHGVTLQHLSPITGTHVVERDWIPTSFTLISASMPFDLLPGLPPLTPIPPHTHTYKINNKIVTKTKIKF